MAVASLLDYFLPERWWFLPADDDANNSGSSKSTMPPPTIPFEIPQLDEHFIREGARLIGDSLSPLNVCHHRVVVTLKKSCSRLSADELGKLSVMLLNCQAATNGGEDQQRRTLHPCTTSMVKQRQIKLFLFFY